MFILKRAFTAVTAEIIGWLISYEPFHVTSFKGCLQANKAVKKRVEISTCVSHFFSSKQSYANLPKKKSDSNDMLVLCN